MTREEAARLMHEWARLERNWKGRRVAIFGRAAEMLDAETCGGECGGAQ